MADNVWKIKQEIERIIEEETPISKGSDYYHGAKESMEKLLKFIDSLPEEPCCKIDLTAENENKNFEEIDRYCTLCMDINCFGCQYHDIHFRDLKW